jgi:hypothetical protein
MDQSTSVVPIAGSSGSVGSSGSLPMLQNIGMSANVSIPTDDVLLVLPCSKEVSRGGGSNLCFSKNSKCPIFSYFTVFSL